MASGTDGPGDGPLPPNKSNEEFIYMQDLNKDGGGRPHADSDVPTVPRSPVQGSRHLSFSDLMANQDLMPAEPATDIRRMSGGGIALERTPGNSGSYNPTLHMDTSLNEEIEKVFEDEPYHLKMDFSNLGMAGNAQNYPHQKYHEGDYSSHRRSQVQMYQPMTTHLSSNELKTIQSAHGLVSAEDSTKRRRHRSSSSSGSGSSKQVGKKADGHLDKRRRKKGKKKKSKRKLLTATMRSRTMSIPEEDEDQDESDEEDDSDDEGEEDQDEEDGGESERKDGGDGTGGDNSTQEMDEPDNDQRGSRKSPTKQGLKSQDGSKSGDGNSEAVGKNVVEAVTNVMFTVGTETPQKSADPQNQAATTAGTPFPPSDKPGSFSSLRSSGKSFSEGSSDSATSDAENSQRPLVNVNEKTKTDGKKKSSKHKKHRHHNHHHKRRHKHDDANQRRLAGDQLKDVDTFKIPKITVGSDDEEDLGGADKSEMQSHRFEDRTGIRKHLLHRPVKRRKIRTEMKMTHDRKPHEVFVELDELVSGEWKETARWIKFEEDVEESQMWGKPRVASLSFHSLLELRKMIEKGAVMLDVEKENLSDVANAVVEEMVNTGQIRAEDQGNILKVLLSKHKHIIPQTAFPYNLSQASISSFFTNQSYASRLHTATNASSTQAEGTQPLMSESDMEKGNYRPESSAGIVTSGPSTKELKIMRKIPEGAEATAVLVGNVDYLEQPTLAFVRLAQGTDLENVVALPIPVRFIFVLLGPSKQDFDYHEIGRSISTLMADQEFHVMAYGAMNRIDLLRAINEFLDDSIVLPPGQLENPDLLQNISKYQKGLAERREKKKRKDKPKEIDDEKVPPPEDDPLKRTGRFFGGFIKDVKRRYPKYLSDITDAFNLQCLASIIFIYFAALSPAITFGGLLGEKTHTLMGVSEMILGCCIGGCMFGLFSGQPLLVVGSTGPLLVFEEAVYNFCIGNDLPFLATRVWIGLWIFVISIFTAMFEGSFLVRYVSRFTQDIFAALISLIFIYETFNKLAKTFIAHPLKSDYSINVTGEYNCSNPPPLLVNLTNSTNGTTEINLPGEILNQPNTALLSTLLMFGTFIIAYFLREFKNSKFLRSSVRRTIGDFGVPIAIFAMLMVDLAVTDTYTQKLTVPKGISPTNSSMRGWFIPPLGDANKPLPVWMIFGSALPAFLVFILIFMESHITETIVSAKERRLKKGTGFHLNILLLGLLNGGLSMFGMPWVCCATVRSITHTNSLTIMSTNQAPGEKARIEGIHEQRVTVFVVNACLGLSILMQPLLKEIPLAVLFGIFLYMGVTSLTGVQFIDRVEMLFMPSKNYPDYSYVKAVRPWRIHIFTLIEVVCLAVLWIVKSTPAQIAFPFFLVLTIPIRRFLLPKIFTPKELQELDGSDVKPSVPSRDQDEHKDAKNPK
uniref:Anion exchange protein n=1 Tax=Phallusia mammillata TaxID=59560 RepID=A0A6F9DS68_9ASCI|nr:anion exchange protein 2 [Phallusia mammillata]